MSDINWKDGVVCYFAKKQWFPNNGALGGMLKGYIHHYNYGDFQLNEIREGDYIPASELDTEQKYNEVVEVFGLFGHESDSQSGYEGLLRGKFTRLTIRKTGFSNVKLNFDCKRKLTYNQIISIGKLKRMMLERGKPATIDENSVQAKLSNIGNVLHNLSCLENDEDLQGELYNYASYLWDLSKSMVNEKSAPKTAPDLTPDKSKQAYDILKSLDYEYDLVKRKWYKKEYID